MKKVVKSKVAEFWCRFPVGGGNTNSPELLLLKFCHYQTTTATSGPPPLISQPFSCCIFLHGLHLFFTVWLFCVGFTSLCNLTCIFAFTGYTAKQDKLTEAKLSSDRPNSSWTAFLVIWTVYWVTWLCDLTLAELSTGWPDSSWTVNWVVWLWLNCLLGDLTLAEMWFDFSWTV